jgi:hypothetical protein
MEDQLPSGPRMPPLGRSRKLSMAVQVASVLSALGHMQGSQVLLIGIILPAVTHSKSGLSGGAGLYLHAAEKADQGRCAGMTQHAAPSCISGPRRFGSWSLDPMPVPTGRRPGRTYATCGAPSAAQHLPR